MRQLLGWTALVGGGLSAAVCGLLLLGPLLGFHGWDTRGPGPARDGATSIPAPLVAASPRFVARGGLTAAVPAVATRRPALALPAPRRARAPAARPSRPVAGAPAPSPAPIVTAPPAPVAVVQPVPAPVPAAAPASVSAAVPAQAKEERADKVKDEKKDKGSDQAAGKPHGNVDKEQSKGPGARADQGHGKGHDTPPAAAPQMLVAASEPVAADHGPKSSDKKPDGADKGQKGPGKGPQGGGKGSNGPGKP